MPNIFQEDFRDFLGALNNAEVKYIMVGGLAVIHYGHPRVTGDMDIWVERKEENYKKLVNAFREFKMPLFDMTLEKFLNAAENDVFTFGRNPVAIDIMTEVKGLDFGQTYSASKVIIDNGLSIRIIHLNDLIVTKKASGRLKDLDDINQLKKRKKK